MREGALGEVVRRVDEDEVEPAARRLEVGGDAAHRDADARTRPARSPGEGAGVAAADVGRGLRLLDQHDLGRTAGSRLEAERTGPGVQVEHRRTLDGVAGLERGEDRLPHPVARGTRAGPRHGEGERAGESGDDAGHAHGSIATSSGPCHAGAGAGWVAGWVAGWGRPLRIRVRARSRALP